MKARKASFRTRKGVIVHAPVVVPREPQHRPPPASRLPSWVTGKDDTCIDAGCESRIEGFVHRHVRGFPLAEYERSDEPDD